MQLNQDTFFNRSPARQIATWLATAAIVCISLALMARFIWLMDRGFDFWDQAFYLMFMQQPASYELSPTLFGFALHPLYEIAGGSIVALRRVAALALVALGAATSLIFMRMARICWRSPQGIQTIAISALLPLAYYELWFVVPGYVWLLLVAGMLLFLAILFLRSPDGFLTSAAMAAAAGIIAVMGRPQGALAFGLLYLAAIVLFVPTNKERALQIIRTFLLTSALAAILAAVLPINAMVEQVRTYLATFGANHLVEVSFLDQQLQFFGSERQLLVAASVLAICLILRSLGLPIPKYAKVIVFVIVVLVIRSELRGLRHLGPWEVGAATTTSALCGLTVACLKDDTDYRLIALLSVAIFIPWIATFGTANTTGWNMHYFTGLSGLIGTFAMLAAWRKNLLVVTLVSCAGLYSMYTILGHALASPYRLAAPIARQTVPTDVGWGSELKLDSKTSEFLSALQLAAKGKGFCRGDMAVDFSGLPGLVYAIGGRMPVFPWLAPGYPNSQQFARAYMKILGPARLSQAWIITRAERGFSMQHLEEAGVSLADRSLVAELQDPLDGGMVKLFAPQALARQCG